MLFWPWWLACFRVSKGESLTDSVFDSIIVFALLAASVHNTYPGYKIKYVPGGPVSGISQPGRYSGLLIYPNGTFSGGSFTPMEHSPETGLNLRLLEVAKLGPTIFPIVFAGTVGSTLRLAARWRAEKGSTIEVVTFH
jgi:hypothetical protein